MDDERQNSDLEALLADLQPELRRRRDGPKAFLSGDEMDDAVQDASLELLVMIRQERVHTSLPGLAHLAVYRKACRHISKQKRHQAVMQAYATHQPALSEGFDDPAIAAEREDEADRVWWAILRLDELERLAVGLRYYEHYSYESIAEVLGFDDAQAVSTCLRRARRRLRRILRGGAL